MGLGGRRRDFIGTSHVDVVNEWPSQCLGRVDAQPCSGHTFLYHMALL